MSNLLGGKRPIETNWIRPEELTNGNSTNYTHRTGYGFTQYPGSLTFDLHKQIDIGVIRFLLFDLDERFYKYKLATSLDGTNYFDIYTSPDTGTKGWQIFNFDSNHLARFIKLECIHNTKNAQFHIVEIECYSKGVHIPALSKTPNTEETIQPVSKLELETTGAYVLPSERLKGVADTLNAMIDLSKKNALFNPDQFLRLKEEILDQINGIQEVERNIGSIQKLVLQPVKKNLVASTWVTLISAIVGLISFVLLLLDWCGIIQV